MIVAHPGEQILSSLKFFLPCFLSLTEVVAGLLQDTVSSLSLTSIEVKFEIMGRLFLSKCVDRRNTSIPIGRPINIDNLS